MLDQNDLEAIRGIMKEELANSENLILSEMDRMQERTKSQIEQVKENLEDLRQYYRITRLENDNTALMIKMIEELSKRVAELEKKTA